MVPLSEYFRSVELIWALWGVSLILLLWLTRKAAKALEWKQWGAVFKEEDGAAYSLSYVMVFPIYLMLILLVVECTLILIVKLGTIYAAYAAARSQIVWHSLLPEDQAAERSNRAAIQAITPYSSSWPGHSRKIGADAFPSPAANKYFQAYKTFSGVTDDYRRYIVPKYRYAEAATKVTYDRILLNGPGELWNANIKATVEYKMPLHAPVIGRLLGTTQVGPGGTFHAVVITSSVSLQDEAPQNQQMNLGVNYDPR